MPAAELETIILIMKFMLAMQVLHFLVYFFQSL